ncbi:MAG: winged helix-turn-helix domain-containing protein [Desulfobaccales bacterium]
MPVIRVSDYVMEILKKYAIPLEDNPDSVLRRILDEYASIKQNNGNLTAKVLDTSNFPRLITSAASTAKINFPRAYAKRYARWIISSLEALGGNADAQTVISQISKVFGHEFSNKDQETLPSGETRWVKNVNWARYDMVKGGLLNADAPYGIWELTEKGKSYYNNSPQISVPTKGERPMTNRTSPVLIRMCREALRRRLEPKWGKLTLDGIWFRAADGRILSPFSKLNQDKCFWGITPGDWQNWDDKCHLALLMLDGIHCSFGLLNPAESKRLLDRISPVKHGEKKINVRLPSTGRIYIQEWPDFPFADRVVELEDKINVDALKVQLQNIDQASLKALTQMLEQQ